MQKLGNGHTSSPSPLIACPASLLMKSPESPSPRPNPDDIPRPEFAPHGGAPPASGKCRGELASEPSLDTRIDDDLVLQSAEGQEGALERLYRGSVRWMRERISRTEAANLSRWGNGVMNELPHEVLSRVFGRDFEILRAIASSERPANRYFSTLETALSRRLIDENRKWRGREALHMPPAADGEGRESDRSVESLSLPSEATPADLAAARDLAERFSRIALETLNPAEYELLRSEFLGEPREAMAIRHGVTTGTLATRISRARAKLREQVEKELNP